MRLMGIQEKELMLQTDLFGGVREGGPCSLFVLSGPARYEWQHCIPARKSDVMGGIKIYRARRVSITFRKVILHHAAR
jgi:hypothetical protein